jgi:hypothetical protein
MHNTRIGSMQHELSVKRLSCGKNGEFIAASKPFETDRAAIAAALAFLLRSGRNRNVTVCSMQVQVCCCKNFSLRRLLWQTVKAYWIRLRAT